MPLHINPVPSINAMEDQKIRLDELFHSFPSVHPCNFPLHYQGINAMEAQKTRLDELVKKHRLSQIDLFRLLQQGALNAQKQT